MWRVVLKFVVYKIKQNERPDNHHCSQQLSGYGRGLQGGGGGGHAALQEAQARPPLVGRKDAEEVSVVCLRVAVFRPTTGFLIRDQALLVAETQIKETNLAKLLRF